MWDLQTLNRLNDEFESKAKLEREELGGEQEFEEARLENRKKD
jgi:hypothetical protein